MIEVRRVGEFKCLWGESARWDDRRKRLYFVDAAALKLHWLEEGAVQPREISMPSLPTGLALTESGRVLVILADGVYLVDVDARTLEKFADNPGSPSEPRLNDAQADRDGNLVTGSLSFTRNPIGAFWWLSSRGSWAELDRGISNTNGPVIRPDGKTLLVVDTSEKAVFDYPYDGARGMVGPRRVLAHTTELAGGHDGATLDTEGRYWSAMVGGSLVVSVAQDGTLEHRIELPVDYPTALAFGGPEQDRLYVTSISLEFGQTVPRAPDAGALLEIAGLEVRGELEPRFAA